MEVSRQLKPIHKKILAKGNNKAIYNYYKKKLEN